MSKKIILIFVLSVFFVSQLSAITGTRTVEVVFVSQDQVSARFSAVRMMNGRITESKDSEGIVPDEYGNYHTSPFYLNCQIFTKEEVCITLTCEELKPYDFSNDTVLGTGHLSWTNISKSKEWENVKMSSQSSSVRLMTEDSSVDSSKPRYYTWVFVLALDAGQTLAEDTYYVSEMKVSIEVV